MGKNSTEPGQKILITTIPNQNEIDARAAGLKCATKIGFIRFWGMKRILEEAHKMSVFILKTK